MEIPRRTAPRIGRIVLAMLLAVALTAAAEPVARQDRGTCAAPATGEGGSRERDEARRPDLGVGEPRDVARGSDTACSCASRNWRNIIPR